MNMNDWLRILIYCVCCFASLYALNGIDLSRLARKGHEEKMLLLYILLSLAIGYGVAEFILGLSRFAIN